MIDQSDIAEVYELIKQEIDATDGDHRKMTIFRDVDIKALAEFVKQVLPIDELVGVDPEEMLKTVVSIGVSGLLAGIVAARIEKMEEPGGV